MRIEDHPFFEGLSEERAARLTDGAGKLCLEPGEIIFEEGSSSTQLYLVLEGTVEFSKRVDDTSYLPVSTSREGEFFGEIGVITGEPRALRATTQSPAMLATLDKEQFEDFMTETSGPVALTLRNVIKHLHQTTQHFMEEVLHREKMAVVGNMVNSIIHDFKNPISYIRLAAEYLTRHHEDPKTHELCELIEKQIGRMLEMADGVSRYSRGEYQPTFAPIRLPDLMDHFRDSNFLFFESESVSISIDVDDIALEAEESTLQRVLQNLVGNAIEALSGPGEIRIAGRERDDHLELTIRDNAGGIPEEIRKDFFDPFVTRGKRGGTGLGTAIAKSIVEAHGGSIWFETEMGVGTVFHIRLPLRH